MKIWKEIEEANNKYLISNDGEVISLMRGKNPRKVGFNPYTGYMQIGLVIDGKVRTRLLHKLVAKAFIPNPNNYPRVNHINRDKTDNRVENLEWCSQQENIHHYYNSDADDKPRQMKPVCVYDKNGNFLAEYPSINQAKHFNNGWPSNIKRCCDGEVKQHKGHIYKYKQ
jgi:hypothetical protein